jgi:hypothetical protein
VLQRVLLVLALAGHRIGVRRHLHGHWGRRAHTSYLMSVF